MNPVLVTGLPVLFQPNDPIYSSLERDFSGEPIEIPGSDPTPDPPTEQDVIRQIQLKNAVQDAAIQWLIEKVSQLEGSR